MTGAATSRASSARTGAWPTSLPRWWALGLRACLDGGRRDAALPGAGGHCLLYTSPSPRD
eukprot:9470170-Alexandrium_andersonii.AAC.1